jgi:hypothetical protein
MIQEFLIGFLLGFMLKPRKKVEEIGVQVSEVWDTPIISEPILISNSNSKTKFLRNFWGPDS